MRTYFRNCSRGTGRTPLIHPKTPRSSTKNARRTLPSRSVLSAIRSRNFRSWESGEPGPAEGPEKRLQEAHKNWQECLDAKDVVTQENTDLKTKNQKLTDELTDKCPAKGKCKELPEDIEECQKQLSQAQDEIVELKKQLAEANSPEHIQQLQKKLSDAEADVTRLETENQKLTDQHKCPTTPGPPEPPQTPEEAATQEEINHRLRRIDPLEIGMEEIREICKVPAKFTEELKSKLAESPRQASRL